MRRLLSKKVYKVERLWYYKKFYESTIQVSEFNKQTLADARLTFFNYLIRR